MRRLSALCRFDGEAEVAALQRAGFVIQPQRGLLLVRTVALVAALLQDRLHVMDEI
jgi:hypothetical protein